MNCKATASVAALQARQAQVPRYNSYCSTRDVLQNSFRRLMRIRVRDNRATYDKIICPRFERLEWSHRSPLIARLRPTRSNSWNNDLDLITEFTTQRFDFVRTGYNSINSCLNA